MLEKGWTNQSNILFYFSKTEANMTKLDRTPFDVSELVEETLLYFSAMAESSGIRLLSFIDPISTDGNLRSPPLPPLFSPYFRIVLCNGGSSQNTADTTKSCGKRHQVLRRVGSRRSTDHARHHPFQDENFSWAVVPLFCG